MKKNIAKPLLLHLFVLFLFPVIADSKVDSHTGIEWVIPDSSRFEDTMAESWEDAIDFCNARGARLPNVIEFLSILDFKKENPALKEGFYRDFEIRIYL